MTQAETVSGPHKDAFDERRWIREAHGVVADLFVHRPAIYWIDLIASAAIAWTATAVYFAADAGSLWQWSGLIVAALAFYRAGTFMHEIIHLPKAALPGFRTAWNALVGIPLLMPWILYRSHIGHHSRAHFGTPDDGEYLPLAAAPLRETLIYLVRLPLLSLMALARFALAAPLSWLHSGLREWVLVRASAYVSNPFYAHRFPRREQARLLKVEILCLAWIVFWLAMTLFGPVTFMHWLMAWALHALTLGINWIRNLAAHRYDNRGGRLSHIEQLQDAVNLTGQTWLTCWLFPVGLRYHALHHLFPGLPYHSMGPAHRRLMTHFGPESPYAAANHGNFFVVVGELLRSASRTPASRSAIATWRRSGQSDRSSTMAG